MSCTRILVASAITALASPSAAAGEYNSGYFGNVAIEGYDPVAYFLEGKPHKGSAEIVAGWQGVMWRFASADNRRKFLLDPQAFAPQFGGLCTEGVARNEMSVNLEPEVFAVVGGKLYLNATASWSELSSILPAAEANWQQVHKLLQAN